MYIPPPPSPFDSTNYQVPGTVRAARRYHGGNMRATAVQLLRSLIIVRLWNGRCAVRNAHAVHTRPRAHTRPCPFTQKGKAAESG